MGIVAFGLTTSMSIVYQNIRNDISDIKANTVTRHEHVQLDVSVDEIRKVQLARTERLIILDIFVADIRTDIAFMKLELKKINDFIIQKYNDSPGRMKDAPFPYSEY